MVTLPKLTFSVCVHSFPISAASFPFPSFVRRGVGEVEGLPGKGNRAKPTLPHLASPYKGEGKKTVAPTQANHSVKNWVNIYHSGAIRKSRTTGPLTPALSQGERE